MLELQYFRNKASWLIEKLKIKNRQVKEIVYNIKKLDEEKRQVQTEQDALLAKVNSMSKEIGALMSKGEKELALDFKNQVSSLKANISDLENKLKSISSLIYDSLVQLPNIPHEKVPAGHSATDNELVYQSNHNLISSKAILPHWDLIKKYNLADFEWGAKISGSGFPFFIGQGSKLQRALVQFFLDYNIQRGYTEVTPPLLVNNDTAFATGQLPDKEGQMYFVTQDELYLIPTSEVPVTNIYRNEIIEMDKLPIKLTAFSNCFRREAGSFGKDVRGLNRVHQFEKVEIVQITAPEKSYDTLEEMVTHVKGILEQLELPFRIIRLCGGDMSFASAMTYDFEVYSLAQQKWLEVSSVSNFETFQTNRLKCRFKDTQGKTHLAHSLNGSALALPRIIACLLENNQVEDGINIPKALHSYFGKDRIC
ncbi:MAG: serine--tRNA ligase [Sediminibacterium sp.]|nr:serine--tRNA ligase [Sediminibacterium sp.]